MKTAFENTQAQIQNSFDVSSFPKDYENYLEILKNPKKVLEVSISVKMDSGEIKVFTGFRSQHNDARGPFKGGIRFHQDVNKDEVKALSVWMSIKCSVFDLPLGGGKGGIIVNPKELSEREIEELSRNYVKAIYKDIGPEVDIPAPDVNTNANILTIMMDEYSKLSGIYSPGSFTGKTIAAGGSKGRKKATAQGGVFVLQEILKLENEKLENKKIIIQGAGNVGLIFAELISELGATIIGISDSKGAIYNENGINISEISQLKSTRKSVIDYSGEFEKLSNEEILEQQCDILVPAALENQITEKNASNIKANIILELANGPTTPEGDKIIENSNINLIPDVLSNAGGVMVSYFEQVQNNTNFYWEEREIEEKLKKKMTEATRNIHDKKQELNSSYRIAAYSIALERIFQAMIDRKY